MTLPQGHPPVTEPKIGVLLVNLGTPDAPTTGAVRRYLKEFLSDPRVVEIPKLVWWPILNGIILNTRPSKSAHAYAQVWTEDGSPLAAITKAQAAALQDRLGAEVLVRWGMRYGNPSIADEIAGMKAAGCERILFAPLYPQYSGATTATAMDALAAQLEKMRWQPALRTLPPYYDDPAHIEALRADTARQLHALDFVPEVLLLSFHGMPERTLHLGDPYHCHCRKTARLLSEALAGEFPDCGSRPLSSRALAGPSGSNPPPTPRWQLRARRGPSGSSLPRPAFRRTASKRWKSWLSGARNSLRKRAASSSRR
jgi:ferrochelatase